MRLALKSIIIFFNQMITASIPIVMAVILIRIIDQSEFGMFRQVTMVYLSLSSILILNIPQSVYYFLPRFPENEQRGFVFQCSIILFTLGVITTALMWFGSDFLARHVAKNPSLSGLLRTYSFFALGNMVSLVVVPVLISKDRVVASGIFTITQSVIRVAVILTTFVLGWTLNQVLTIVVATSFISTIAGMIVLFQVTEKGPLFFRANLIRQQFSYVIPLAAAGVMGILASDIDKWIIMGYYDSRQYAIYSVGAFRIPIISLVVTSITYAILPTIVKLGEENKVLEALHIWHEGIRKCALVVFPAYFYFLIIGRDLITILFTKDYAAAIGPFVVYLTLLPIQMAVYGTLLRAVGKTKPILMSAILGLVSHLLVSLFLVNIFRDTYLGFIAPAIGTVVAALIAIVFLLHSIKKTIQVTWKAVFPWRSIGKLALTSALCSLGGLPLIWLPIHEISRVLIVFLVYLIIYILVLWFLEILRKDEKHLAIQSITMIYKKAMGQKSV